MDLIFDFSGLAENREPSQYSAQLQGVHAPCEGSLGYVERRPIAKVNDDVDPEAY